MLRELGSAVPSIVSSHVGIIVRTFVVWNTQLLFDLNKTEAINGYKITFN